MKCPHCNEDNDRVVDSRLTNEGAVIRRRRECLDCFLRYTTYERIEETPLRVVKKSGERVRFERERILNGMILACEKLPVAVDLLEQTTLAIEAKIHEGYDREVPSTAIGSLVMDELRSIDPVAYVRFASVYREFRDIREFLEELRPMMDGDGDEGEASSDAGGTSAEAGSGEQ
ncbi:MAG: transcriptional repressor NrdR [Planctomycetota bacterium]|jgi:transcriptional repressor NrdR